MLASDIVSVVVLLGSCDLGTTHLVFIDQVTTQDPTDMYNVSQLKLKDIDI